MSNRSGVGASPELMQALPSAALWILLPHNPHDWRWLLEREDSVWYPTARLFRQRAPGDWHGVVNRIRADLGRHFDV